MFLNIFKFHDINVLLELTYSLESSFEFDSSNEIIESVTSNVVVEHIHQIKLMSHQLKKLFFIVKTVMNIIPSSITALNKYKLLIDYQFKYLYKSMQKKYKLHNNAK